MNYILYKAISPSGRIYVGVTNNFKRRMKEHLGSKYPFGHAVRKYGRENFSYEFEYFDSAEEALLRESELIKVKEAASPKFYNCSVGGTFSNVLNNDNPMHNKDVLENHPNIWTTENNPMNNPDSKKRMIESQNRKRVSIDGVEYSGVREAARVINSYRQYVIHRLKSQNFPDWYYL